MRALMTSWIVSGTSAPPSRSDLTISSTKNGLPSALRAIVASTSPVSRSAVRAARAIVRLSASDNAPSAIRV